MINDGFLPSITETRVMTRSLGYSGHNRSYMCVCVCARWCTTLSIPKAFEHSIQLLSLHPHLFPFSLIWTYIQYNIWDGNSNYILATPTGSRTWAEFKSQEVTFLKTALELQYFSSQYNTSCCKGDFFFSVICNDFGRCREMMMSCWQGCEANRTCWKN